MQAGRVDLQITLNAKDISKDLKDYLIGFSFVDNAHGKADDITITLQDRDELFLKSWLPEKTDSVTAKIVPNESWHTQSVVPCGDFQIDEIVAKGYPRTIEIKGVSVPIDSSIRREKHSKTWTKITLKQIAEEIAERGSLTLSYESDNDPYYQSRYQHDQSDLAFVQRLAEDADLSVKIADGKLVVFDSLKYEIEPASFTIKADDYRLISYDLKTQSHGIYKAATVRYHSSDEKKAQVYTYSPPNAPKVGQILNIDERVDSLAEAKTLAMKKLRQSNKREITGSIVLVGDTDVYPGKNFNLEGFGRFDQKYHIEKVTHSIANGYTITLEFHKCIEEY